ncbi:nervous system development [Seminavis robusta]|uniref:Nervous system development n=1 Tax=Seminavis robusta TaxID=568900 RepID=A0A9N8H0P5_9STRA|nr:nervous system development [Seminavis robusta]|eukprot:Sro24_g016520.1 nervous system development (423) ;mRNA; f:126777-128045
MNRAECDPVDEIQDEEFKWRGDPAETFSDWTIEIVAKKVAQGSSPSSILAADDPPDKDDDDSLLFPVETYHVHKCNLAYGKRKSEYFANLFRSGKKFQESKSSTSRIALDPLAAQAFPRLLNFVYTERPLEVDTHSATALYFLGEYFGIRTLCQHSKQFFEQDISLDNLDTYYEHSIVFQNETIQTVLARFMGNNILEIPPTAPIVLDANPSLWANVVRNFHHLTDEGSKLHLSKLVAANGTSHLDELDMRTLMDLTDERKLPQVHPSVALQLCELEDRLCQNQKMPATSSSQSDLSSIQRRCSVALSETWGEIEIDNTTTAVTSLLQNRKSVFLVDLLIRCLCKAKDDIRKVRNEMNRIHSFIKNLKPLPESRLHEVQYEFTVALPDEFVEHNPETHFASTYVQPAPYSSKKYPLFYYVEI